MSEPAKPTSAVQSTQTASNLVDERFKQIGQAFNQGYMIFLQDLLKALNLDNIPPNQLSDDDKNWFDRVNQVYQRDQALISADAGRMDIATRFCHGIHPISQRFMKRDIAIFTTKLKIEDKNKKVSYKQYDLLSEALATTSPINTRAIYDSISDEPYETKEGIRDDQGIFWGQLLASYRLSVIITFYCQVPFVREVIDTIMSGFNIQPGEQINATTLMPKILGMMKSNKSVKQRLKNVMKDTKAFKQSIEGIQLVLIALGLDKLGSGNELQAQTLSKGLFTDLKISVSKDDCVKIMEYLNKNQDEEILVNALLTKDELVKVKEYYANNPIMKAMKQSTGLTSQLPDIIKTMESGDESKVPELMTKAASTFGFDDSQMKEFMDTCKEFENEMEEEDEVGNEITEVTDVEGKPDSSTPNTQNQ